MFLEIKFIWDFWTNFLFRNSVWHVQWPVVMACWWNATVMSTTVTNNIVQIKEPNGWRARHHAKDDLESCPCTKFNMEKIHFFIPLSSHCFTAQWKKINIPMHCNAMGEHFEEILRKFWFFSIFWTKSKCVASGCTWLLLAEVRPGIQEMMVRRE